MRGTRGAGTMMPMSVGIIPAYAGNTMSANDLPINFRDHPRVCGEHVFFADIDDFYMGSSPRMRGTPYLSEEFATLPGIIPAYAGNTHVLERTYNSCRDHPRVCGEHGTQIMDDCGTVGIIPAYAGNT